MKRFALSDAFSLSLRCKRVLPDRFVKAKSRVAASIPLSMDFRANRLSKRFISDTPIKILDAPGVLDDFYANLLSWSKNGLFVALGDTLYCYSSGIVSDVVCCENSPITSVCTSDNFVVAGCSRGSLRVIDKNGFVCSEIDRMSVSGPEKVAQNDDRANDNSPSNFLNGSSVYGPDNNIQNGNQAIHNNSSNFLDDIDDTMHSSIVYSPQERGLSTNQSETRKIDSFFSQNGIQAPFDFQTDTFPYSNTDNALNGNISYLTTTSSGHVNIHDLAFQNNLESFPFQSQSTNDNIQNTNVDGIHRTNNSNQNYESKFSHLIDPEIVQTTNSTISESINNNTQFSDNNNLRVDSSHLVNSTNNFVGIQDSCPDSESSTLIGDDYPHPKKFSLGNTRVGALSIHENLIACGHKDGRVTLLDLRVGKTIKTLKIHNQEITAIAINKNGRTLATGSNDNTAKICDLRTGYSKIIANAKSAIKGLDWCPWKYNELAIGCGTNDKTLRLIDTTTGNELKRVDTQSQVCALAFCSRTKEIITAHGFQSNSIEAWAPQSLRRICKFGTHEARVLSIAISPDGCQVASLGADENLKFWELCANTLSERKRETLSFR